MKKYIIPALALLPALVSGCKDDNFPGYELRSEGEEVVFAFPADNRTRTMYQDDWDASTTQALFWGNYIEAQGDDYITVFCKQGGKQAASYKVTPSDENSNTAASVEKTEINAVSWGSNSVPHEFYGFYPSEKTRTQFANTDGTQIYASVDWGQSPKTYTVVGNAANSNINVTDNALAFLPTNTKQSAANAVTVYGKPAMKNALMMAYTPVPTSDYGKPVPLNFHVLADVLDFQVNGPVTPNKLNGTEAGAKQFISIRNVRLESIDGTNIAGDFILDLNTGRAVEGSVTNGSSTIQLQTAQVDGTSVNYPALYARVNKTINPDGTPAEALTEPELDHLRLRAFLIPGAVKNLSNLKVVVESDCGVYEQPLQDYAVQTGSVSGTEIVTGQIHRVKLGFFNTRGTDFKFDSWMSQLDRNIYVTELSIPGAWHAPVSTYQSKTNYVDQYKLGIRAFEAHVSSVVQDTPSYTVTSTTTGAYGTPTSSISYNPSTASTGQTNSTRTVTATVKWTRSATVTQTGTINEVKFTCYNSGGGNMMDGITNLCNVISKEAFCVLELGDPESSNITVPVTGSTVTRSSNQSQTITKTITGTQTYSSSTGNGKNIKYSFDAPTATNVTWNTPLTTQPTDAEWTEATTTQPSWSGTSAKWSGGETKSVNSFVAGLSYIIPKMIENGVAIYDKPVTPNTTIGDVAGKLIIKINTNQDERNESNWPENFPAIFSRWQKNNPNDVVTCNLRWGAPIVESGAFPTGVTPMYWVSSELDNIGSDVKVRETAINALEAESYKNYSDGMHNAWYMISIGGYLNSTLSWDNTVAVSKELKPYMYQTLSNPNRKAIPMGIIFMNDVASTENNTQDLIRTIINNNAAFVLNKRNSSLPDVKSNTNSSFINNTTNPLK